MSLALSVGEASGYLDPATVAERLSIDRCIKLLGSFDTAARIKLVG